MKRAELINAIVEKYGYTTYLEIGVRAPWLNFDLVGVKALAKIGVDPNPLEDRPGIVKRSSDDFFRLFPTSTFQVIFIDGDHSYIQSLRDLRNAVEHLAPDGTIVAHDVNPLHESHQGATHVPDPKNNPLNMCMGEAWRSWLVARSIWPSLTIHCRDDLDAPSDCGLLQPWNKKLSILDAVHPGTYHEFSRRDELIDLRTWEEAQGVL